MTSFVGEFKTSSQIPYTYLEKGCTFSGSMYSLSMGVLKAEGNDCSSQGGRGTDCKGWGSAGSLLQCLATSRGICQKDPKPRRGICSRLLKSRYTLHRASEEKKLSGGEHVHPPALFSQTHTASFLLTWVAMTRSGSGNGDSDGF